jgi:putative Holliday junction resolvase
MRYLGIDYGTKRIGIAISNEDGEMAFPNCVLANDNKIIQNIEKIVKDNDVKKIVMGESKNYKMQDNEIMEDVLNLKMILEKLLEIDVVLHPEVLTSVEAEKIQGKNNMSDASAASIILQNYLDTEKYKNIKNKA